VRCRAENSVHKRSVYPVGAGVPAKKPTWCLAPAAPVFAGMPAPTKNQRFASDPLFFHKPESVTVSAQARQYAHSRITLVEVPMGKLALFLGGFLLLTILIGILGTIPPS